MDGTEDRILPKPVKWALIVVVTALVLGGAWIGLQRTGLTRYLQYRWFYAASEAMIPTLEPDERFFGDMGDIEQIRRGDVLIVRVGGDEWVKRVVALPGDRFSMKEGFIQLNGAEVPQEQAGARHIADYDGLLFTEQLPGEAAPHRIVDTSYSAEMDEYPEVTLPAHRYFFLGDNRDHSADSRFAARPEDAGMGLVERGQIIGRVVLPGE